MNNSGQKWVSNEELDAKLAKLYISHWLRENNINSVITKYNNLDEILKIIEANVHDSSYKEYDCRSMRTLLELI